jgi:hypothetical protein
MNDNGSKEINANFEAEVLLQEDIFVKYLADLPTSELNPIVEANDYDLSGDHDIGVSCLLNNSNSIAARTIGEQQRQIVRNIMTPQEKNIKGVYQIVKKINITNPKVTEDWGGVCTDNGRMIYAGNFMSYYDMGIAIGVKYGSYGVGLAPIEPYLVKNHITMVTFLEQLALAKTAWDLYVTKIQYAEEQMRLRDINWAPVMARTLILTSYIMTLYAENSKGAAAYGITVVLASPHPVNQKSKVSPMENKTLKGLVKDSFLYNNNPFAITLICGRKSDGKLISMAANSKVVIGKGMSVLQVFNTDTSNVAEIGSTIKLKGKHKSH